MSTTWLGRWIGKATRQVAATPLRCRPQLEALEDRCVPSGLVIQDLTTGVTATTLASTLAGPGVTVSNATFTGSNMAAGTFSGGNGILGFDSGIVLDTGNVNDLPGPNKSDSTSTDFGLPGNPNLDAILNGSGTTQDAATLDFDIVPTGNTVTFSYVFGSEEYNEFVDSGFNDVFGFFVNGKNVALVPGTNTPVSVDSINLMSNSQLYRNNALSTDPDPTSNPINIELDGITVVLQATASVTPNQVNHIELSIGDVGDGIFDSAVFLQTGTLTNAPGPQQNVGLTAYRPFRYAFRTLEENLGIGGFAQVGGGASTPTYDGVVTVVNSGNADAKGPLTLTFRNLPAGVEVVNATGTDKATGDPQIIESIDSLPVGGVLRVPVKIRNPFGWSLGSFFEGPYFIDVNAAGAA
jgi:hypothetical protein